MSGVEPKTRLTCEREAVWSATAGYWGQSSASSTWVTWDADSTAANVCQVCILAYNSLLPVFLHKLPSLINFIFEVTPIQNVTCTAWYFGCEALLRLLALLTVLYKLSTLLTYLFTYFPTSVFPFALLQDITWLQILLLAISYFAVTLIKLFTHNAQVPLSPSGIICYLPEDSYSLQLRRQCVTLSGLVG